MNHSDERPLRRCFLAHLPPLSSAVPCLVQGFVIAHSHATITLDDATAAVVFGLDNETRAPLPRSLGLGDYICASVRPMVGAWVTEMVWIREDSGLEESLWVADVILLSS